METPVIATDTWYVDVGYQGLARLIACGVLETEAGLLLVDPGPATALPGLEAGLADADTGLDAVQAVLLTHIHLDHAGTTGTIVKRYPDVQVYVHRIGARHLVDPGRLLASARRIYGDQMDTLWGDVLPVPETNVHALQGGEHLDLGGRLLEVAYTPGHAIHHVSYLDRATGTAFVGDTAGMRVTGIDYHVPVTPPPDIDLDAWAESFATLRACAPDRLFLTHFGPIEDAVAHLHAAEAKLHDWAEAVRRSLEVEADDAERAEAFHREEMHKLYDRLTPEEVIPYKYMGQPRGSWYGLARYWRKRGR